MMEAIRGNIFDIRRFTLHDGAGIRTTFFLKGCPLRCVWCQNPEGIAPQSTPVYFSQQCIHCGHCLATGAMQKTGDKQCISEHWQATWAQAVEDCPVNALVLSGRLYTVAEALAAAVRDRVFYQQAGGITLSGGEPLAQPLFTLAFLQALQAAGIHTALETSLYAPRAVVAEILPHVDFLYADLKLLDGKRHRRATGVDNRRIKDNIRWVLQNFPIEQVVIRTPLIPEFTADVENIHSIAKFLADCNGQVQYELLNYNPLAEAKYHDLPQMYGLSQHYPPYSDHAMAQFRQIARSAGIVRLIEN